MARVGPVPGAARRRVAPSGVVDPHRDGGEDGGSPLPPGAQDPDAPVLHLVAAAPPVSVDPDTGCVTACTVVGGDGAGLGRRVILRFTWRPADPLAVVLDIETRPDHPALPRGSWVVLRDFLRYGLSAPTGDGDVRIRPGPSGGTPTVTLTLARTQRPCTVVVPAAVLDTFLRRTETSVPLGDERSDDMIESLIARLLDH